MTAVKPYFTQCIKLQQIVPRGYKFSIAAGNWRQILLLRAILLLYAGTNHIIPPLSPCEFVTLIKLNVWNLIRVRVFQNWMLCVMCFGWLSTSAVSVPRRQSSHTLLSAFKLQQMVPRGYKFGITAGNKYYYLKQHYHFKLGTNHNSTLVCVWAFFVKFVTLNVWNLVWAFQNLMPWYFDWLSTSVVTVAGLKYFSLTHIGGGSSWKVVRQASTSAPVPSPPIPHPFP